MKINTSQEILNLKGEPLMSDGEEVTLGTVVANALLGDSTGGKMKLYILAKKFYGSKSVEVDEADLKMVKDAVSKSTSYNALVVGQAELMLSDVTEAGKK